MATKRFHISDIISITSGKLVSLDHIGGVYNILNWMTDDNLMTHQFRRAMDECQPTLLAAFPDLAGIDIPQINSAEDVQTWMADLESQGVKMWREVPRLEPKDHARIDPLLELNHMVGGDKVIPVVVE